MLNLYFLKYFSDAARTRSIGQSARINRLTRSAISQSIKKLEDQLGASLLVHQKNHFELTSAGQLLSEKCGAILQQVELLKELLTDAKAGGAGPLRFAASHSIALSVLPKILGGLTQEYPGLVPLFRTADAVRGRELLRKREVDLLVAVDDGGFNDFETVLLGQVQFVLVQSSFRNKSPDDLRFIVGDKGSEIEELRKVYLKRFKRALPVFMEIESWETIARLAAEGLGVGYIPDFIFESRSWPNLKSGRLGLDLPEYNLLAATRELESLPKNAKLLLDGLVSRNSKRG